MKIKKMIRKWLGIKKKKREKSKHIAATSAREVGEYFVGPVRISILKLGTPELHECNGDMKSNCGFRGDGVQMRAHVASTHKAADSLECFLRSQKGRDLLGGIQ